MVVKLTCPGCGAGLLGPADECACGGRGAGALPRGRRTYAGRVTVAQALAELDARRREWDRDRDERFWRSYVAETIRSQRPDPAACMRKLLRMRRRWLADEQR